MSSPSSTISAEVCILGAGPHGLAAAVHLRRARPDMEIVVVDPAGEWLAGWRNQFAQAEIQNLRSPIVHHPAPNPFELTDYIRQHGLPRSGLPYDPPRADVFASFCADLVAGAGLDQPLKGHADAVSRKGRGVSIQAGRIDIEARHLVVATNPHRRQTPDWVWPLLGSRPGLVAHGADVDLRSFSDLDGERVVIVGGGLTAAHLVCGASARGADVRLVARRPLETRDFDTDPGWLGPRFLGAFSEVDDPASRLDSAIAARGGGTIPPWMRHRLDDLFAGGRVTNLEGRVVRAASIDTDGSYVLALDDHTTVPADRIWLATGTTADITACRFLADLLADVPLWGRFPIPDESLRLGPHPIHIMGRPAMLTLGPASGNLWGAQRAAAHITRALTGVELEHESIVHQPGHV